MHRARVVLPEPVSPTRPRVWPRRSFSDTPSTACTWPTVRASSPGPRIGKYLTRFSTRTSTSSSPGGAAAGVAACGLVMRSRSLPPPARSAISSATFAAASPRASPTLRLRASSASADSPAALTGSQHADRWNPSSPTGISVGSSVRHLSITYAHRGWNAHPDGTLIRLGGWPVIGRSRSAPAELFGIDSSSPLV